MIYRRPLLSYFSTGSIPRKQFFWTLGISLAFAAALYETVPYLYDYVMAVAVVVLLIEFIRIRILHR